MRAHPLCKLTSLSEPLLLNFLLNCSHVSCVLIFVFICVAGRLKTHTHLAKLPHYLTIFQSHISHTHIFHTHQLRFRARHLFTNLEHKRLYVACLHRCVCCCTHACYVRVRLQSMRDMLKKLIKQVIYEKVILFETCSSYETASPN